MPYITRELRKAIDGGMIPMSPGELNYQLFKLVDTYIKDQGNDANHEISPGDHATAEQVFTFTSVFLQVNVEFPSKLAGATEKPRK